MPPRRSTLDWTELDDTAVDTVRVLAMDAVQKVGNGHPGTAMSLAPAAYLLFQKVMRHDPADPDWVSRDRFVLSCGHSSLTLYIQLFLGGWGLELEDLKSLRTWGSKTPGHPEYGHTAGVETTTGPLGQGVGNAVGMAMAARRQRGLFDPEAAAGAVALRPPHLRARAPTATWRRASAPRPPRSPAPEARQPDPDLRRQPDLDRGRHQHRLHRGRRRALRGLRLARPDRRLDQRRQGVQGGRPAPCTAPSRRPRRSPTSRASSVLRTIIAWPAPNAQGTGKAHGSALGDDEVAATKKVLGFDPEQTFEVPRRRHRPHPPAARPRRRRTAPSGTSSTPPGPRRTPTAPSCSHRLQEPHAARRAGTPTLPTFPADEKGVATRKASGAVHPGHRRRRCPSSGAARPTWPSPTTPPSRTPPSFIPEERATKMWKADPYAGRVLHFGIREHGMGAIMNGIAAHGGTRVFGGTFLTFSDYMRPAVRLAALMQLPVTYVWTHDSIGLGEDGPTHQPVEHLAALRAIPGLDVVRPGDANETAACWKAMIEHTDRPAGHHPDPAERADLPARRGRLRRHRRRGQGRLRAARRRGRHSRRGARRHRLGGPARGARRARSWPSKGIDGPRRLDAVPRVVRRAGPPPTARRSSRPTLKARVVGRGRHRPGLARDRRRPRPDRLARALRRLGRLRPHLPRVRHHRRGRGGRGRGQHPHRHRLTHPLSDQAHGRNHMTDHLQQLTEAGVSIWLDDLSRERIETGNLAELIKNDNVVGVTTNPSIFAAALAEGERYDDQVRELAAQGADVDKAVFALTTTDVRNACDVLKPVFEATNGVDGRVSIEVSPEMAHDTDATFASAQASCGRRSTGRTCSSRSRRPPRVVPAISDTLARGHQRQRDADLRPRPLPAA